jgi:hypothetical protein
MLAATCAALICVMPVVQATRSQLRVRSSPMTNAVLLQHNATRKFLLHQPVEGGLPSDFFTHDAEKMDELPDYGKPKGCHPKCTWNCGGGCDQVCNPVCAPPKCETSCGALSLSMCHQRCGPPRCAVVCPPQCEHDECPKCKTICGPPDCQTICNPNCESRCADPQCSWNCKPSDQCAAPQCKLDCTGPKVCNMNADTNARPNVPIQPDKRVMSRGLGNLDPTSLQPGATPPSGAVAPGAIAEANSEEDKLLNTS